MAEISHFSVRSDPTDYPVYVGKSLIDKPEFLLPHIRGNQALIVTNETVAPLYLHSVQHALTDIQCDVVVLPDGEQYKDHTHLSLIYDALMRCQHHRDTTVLALGGGVVGDMAGFAAATYQRGVHWMALPTTLLAQIDASIGGKTAINLPTGKNMVGSFYQPQAVFIDLAVLQTLPEREFRAGLAEVIKYGILVGGDFLLNLPVFLSHFQSADFFRDASSMFNTDTFTILSDTIIQSCKIKANFVQEDVFDRGIRALLNLGHTFAHALETATCYQRWLHGEAVAIGLYCASLLSYDLGYIDEKSVDFVEYLLTQAKLEYRIPSDLNIDDLLRWMWRDKKVKQGLLAFVVIEKFGFCRVDSRVTETEIKKVLYTAQQIW